MQIATFLIQLLKLMGKKRITILNLYCFLPIWTYVSINLALFLKIRLSLSERVTFPGIPFEFINKITIMVLIYLAAEEFLKQLYI